MPSEQSVIPGDMPEVELVGSDGNAFAIMGKCARAARRAGWTKEQIAAFQSECMSGDYDNLLQTAMKYFDVN